MNQYCPVCGETRCARVDAESPMPCVTVRTEYKGLEDQAVFAQQRESAMAQNVYVSAKEWMAANRNASLAHVETTTPIAQWTKSVAEAKAHYAGLLKEARRYDFVAQRVNPSDVGVRSDPDEQHVPLPPKPALFREFEAQKHDFIGALYRPYVSPI